MVRSAWYFIRDHFWAGVIIVVILAALLYRPIAQSSPVVERMQFEGTVAAITNAGESWLGRQPRYGYQITPADGGEPVIVRVPSLHRIGDHVTVERIERRNGNITHQIVSGPAPP